MRCYDYKIKLFDVDGSFLRTSYYTVKMAATSDPEFDAGEANLDAYNHAEQLMIAYDANEYSVEKTDAG